MALHIDFWDLISYFPPTVIRNRSSDSRVRTLGPRDLRLHTGWAVWDRPSASGFPLFPVTVLPFLLLDTLLSVSTFSTIRSDDSVTHYNFYRKCRWSLWGLCWAPSRVSHWSVTPHCLSNHDPSPWSRHSPADTLDTGAEHVLQLPPCYLGTSSYFFCKNW